MRKRLLKSWLIGLGISLFGFALSAVVHTPLETIGFLVSVPGTIGMALIIELGHVLGVPDNAMLVASIISVPIFGSLVYGALVYLVLRSQRKSGRA